MDEDLVPVDDDLEPIEDDLEPVEEGTYGPPISASEIEDLKKPKGEMLRDVLSKMKQGGVSSLTSFEKDQLRQAISDTSVSPVMAFATHAGNSAVSGFGDEALAANMAMYKKLKGDESPISDLYKGQRDENRRYLERGRQQNPWSSMAGDVAGAIAGGAVTPAGTQSLIAQGALSGAGYSDADSFGGLAKDAAIGAGSAYVADKVLGALGNAVKKYKPGARAIDAAGNVMEAPAGALNKLEEYLGSKDAIKKMGPAKADLANAARDTTADRLLKQQALSGGLGGNASVFLARLKDLGETAEKPLSELTQDELGTLSEVIAKSVKKSDIVNEKDLAIAADVITDRASVGGNETAKDLLKSFLLGHNSRANVAKRVATADRFGEPVVQALGQSTSNEWKELASRAAEMRRSFDAGDINEMFSGPAGSIPKSSQAVEPWAKEAMNKLQNRAYGRNAIEKIGPIAGAATGLAAGGPWGATAGYAAGMAGKGKGPILSTIAATSTIGRSLKEIAAKRLAPAQLADELSNNSAAAQELSQMPGKLGMAGKMIIDSLQKGGSDMARSRAWIIAQQPWFREQLEQGTAEQAPP